MRKTTVALLFLASIVAVICALLAWVALRPARRPNISITFLGYTNDPAGTRVGKFAISNLSSSAVTQWAPFHVMKTPAGWESVPGGSFGFEILTQTGWTGRSKGFLPGNQILGPGASEVLRFPMPTNQSAWKIIYRVNPDVGVVLYIKRALTYPLQRIGLDPGYHIRPYNFDSEWIEDER